MCYLLFNITMARDFATSVFAARTIETNRISDKILLKNYSVPQNNYFSIVLNDKQRVGITFKRYEIFFIIFWKIDKPLSIMYLLT